MTLESALLEFLRLGLKRGLSLHLALWTLLLSIKYSLLDSQFLTPLLKMGWTKICAFMYRGTAFKGKAVSYGSSLL